MPVLAVSPAIVLRTRSFGESDKIVTLLSRDYGKVTGIAKGAKRSRKRFVNTLEPFSLVNLRFQERAQSSLVFIHACDWLQVFKHLTTGLEKIAMASYMVEITDELTREREESRAIFEHLKQGLVFLEEQGSSASYLTFFEMRLLTLSGYQPMLECCRRCGKKRPEPGERFLVKDSDESREYVPQWCFSPRDGGILCRSCHPFRKETLPLSLEALNALARLQEIGGWLPSSPGLSGLALKETRSILPRFIQFQINKELKSAPFLETFCMD
jgi:DNA repair protein RecO (recombination protein O)